jgi:hemerythrin-like domain-containing protein
MLQQDRRNIEGGPHQSASMHTEKMADSRDMIGAHDAIRREFDALPTLVRGVAAGNAHGTAVIADHVDLMAEFLHAHHASEDDHVWPKLLDRCPAEVEPLVSTMESQHALIDAELRALSGATRHWRASAGAADRDAVAAVAARIIPALREHLALEESDVLPLIDGHLTDREWKATVAASLAKVRGSKKPMMMGMAIYQAREDQLRLLRAAVPAVAWLVLRPLGERAYRSYRARLAAATR